MPQCCNWIDATAPCLDMAVAMDERGGSDYGFSYSDGCGAAYRLAFKERDAGVGGHLAIVEILASVRGCEYPVLEDDVSDLYR